MSQSKAYISGIPEKTPQINIDGNIYILFKIPCEKTESGLKKNESLYKVVVDKTLWKDVSSKVDENSYYIIEGNLKACVNSKGLPYITVKCLKIKVLNFLVKNNTEENSYSLKELPFNTEDVLPLSSLKIKENMPSLTTARNRALKYIEKYGTFQNPVVVERETKTVISGYAEYVVAKELNISMVPVVYSNKPLNLSKDEASLRDVRWYNPNEVIEIETDKIVLTEEVHFKTLNFTFNLDLRRIAESMEIKVPVAVRLLSDGRYSLVMGVSRYFTAKILDIKKLPAVITDMNHDEFVKNRLAFLKALKINEIKPVETLLSMISIPEKFKSTPPRREKIQEAIDYYRIHGNFDKPIIIKGENNMLVDGYKRYLAAYELNLQKVWTKKI